MSKLGKKPIAVPAGVQVTLEGARLTVKGPKGTLTRDIPSLISVTVTDGQVAVGLKDGDRSSRENRAQWGLWRSLTSNMVHGVSEGWSRTLEFQGVGYKAAVKGNDLELSLGYSHPITVTAPEGISFATDKTTITVSGIDREAVGHVAANIRTKRLPEPYKGSGIRYSDEIIKKKAGKKAATAA
jgi:large subunit ribosomal protein L6